MKHSILLLCAFSIMHGMEEHSITTTREPREWDAKAYAQGNGIQEMAALQFLQESMLSFENKKVLDVGCGTGNISAKIATSAQHVHGIDASNNMFEYAQQTYGTIPNLSFEHSFAEDFTPQTRYNIATTFFCLHWIKNKRAALEKINNALEIGGDFFGTIRTTSDPKEPLSLTVALESITELQPTYSSITNSTEAVDTSSLTDDDEFKLMLTENGFKIVSYEQKTVNYILNNKNDLITHKRPTIMSRPIIKAMSEISRESFFTQYIDLDLTKLTKNEDGHYIFPLHTTIFHARKRADILHMPHGENGGL